MPNDKQRIDIRTGSPADSAAFGGKMPSVKIGGRLTTGRYRDPDEPANVNRRGPALLGDFKGGGVVKKTGVYKLHKGEKVVAAKPVKKAPAHRKAAAPARPKRRR